jgi:thioesterase domain-containing protein
MVAFEVAQQLQKQGEEVALLLLLDPSNPRHGELSAGSGSGFPPSTFDVKMRRGGFYDHLRHLAALRPRERAAYVMNGLKWRMRASLNGIALRWTQLNAMIKLAACELYVFSGRERSMPSTLRATYISRAYRRALRDYVPQVYPGRVVLLKTEDRLRDPRPVWERLAGAGLEVVQVTGKHTEIVFKEPQIAGLAHELSA